MSMDLKPYFDSARAADDEVQRVMAEMNTAFTDGTDAGKTKALELRPSLDAAKKKALEDNELYISMRNAVSVSDGVAKKFVPVNEAAAEIVKGAKPKTIKRQEYDAMSLVDRSNFIRDGGTVED